MNFDHYQKHSKKIFEHKMSDIVLHKSLSIKFANFIRSILGSSFDLILNLGFFFQNSYINATRKTCFKYSWSTKRTKTSCVLVRTCKTILKERPLVLYAIVNTIVLINTASFRRILCKKCDLTWTVMFIK